MKKLIVILIILIANLSTSVSAQESIESLVKNYLKSHQIPGAVIGIIKNDSLVYLNSYGLADAQNNAEVNDSTTFELGSLTKQFTATAVLKLHQDNKLDIEDHLYEHFPECPYHWKEIKIKHLIWHTSGLPGMFPHDAFTQPSFTGYSKMDASRLDKMMQTNTVSKELAIQSIITDSLDFKPGTKYNYSDVGYLLLGIVIDNITGSYHDFMVNSIFAEAKMKNTYLLNQEKVVLNQARGYSLKNGELINILRTWDYEIPSFFGIFSNVDDLIKWNQALETNRLLNDQNHSFLFTQGKLDNGISIEYGGGWEINKINGVKFISHNGVTGTKIVKVPSAEFCLIILTNLGYNGNDFVDPWSLSNELLSAYGIETKINKNHITIDGQKVIQFNKKHLKNIEGNYATDDNLKATIFIEDGIPYFELQGLKNELALLENCSWLVLGMEYEYILSYSDDTNSLTTNYGRIFNKK
jgi:CubicO group peptidase (beta-lactamase class C family)